MQNTFTPFYVVYSSGISVSRHETYEDATNAAEAIAKDRKVEAFVLETRVCVAPSEVAWQHPYDPF